MFRRKFLLVSSLVLALAAGSSAWAQEPTVQASGVTVDRFSGRSMRISWTPGDGDGSMVVMRAFGVTRVDPADGDDYVPDRDYSATPESELNPTPSGHWVVHKGPGNEVWVIGLAVNSTYSIAVYEYSGTGATTDYYLLIDQNVLDQSTSLLASHNEDLGINCNECHYHSSFGARDAELQTVCENCHNPDGAASAKLMFANHTEPLKNPDVEFVDCGVCHEVHIPGTVSTTESTHSVTGATQQNKSFLRANVDKYIAGAATPAYLHTDQPKREAGNPNLDPTAAAVTPDRAVEGGDGSTARGYCQVCHTLTNYHRSTGDYTGADPIAQGFPECHDPQKGNLSCGENGIGGPPTMTAEFQTHCGDCHEHNNRFEGAGSCTACHNTKQPDSVNGPRPVITTMFDRRSTHIPGGSGSVAQEDCEVCHDQTGHPGDGIVGLLDADDAGGPYEQLTPDASTLATGEGVQFEPACLSCHDANGASRLTGTGSQTPDSPFTGSGAPRPISATNWATSGHDDGGMTCVGDGTNGCHGSGHGSEQDKLLAPAVGTLLTLKEFCFTCHNGTVASTNVEAEFTNLALLTNLPNNAPIESGSGALVDNYHDTMLHDGILATVSCGDCHSPHVDNPNSATAPVMGDPDTAIPVSYYQATGTGASYNEDGKSFNYYSALTDLDPVNPEGATLGPFTEPDYIQFCLACHDGTTPPDVTMTSQMINIADAYGGIGQTSQDVHGGGAPSGQGSSTNKGGMKIPWVTAADDALNYDPTGPYAALNCTTCHGAHGTENIFNLRTSITVADVEMRIGGVGNMPVPARITDTRVYTLPSVQPRRNDPIGQYDHYWGAWCSFCHKMDGSHQNVNELDKCTSGHMHGGGAF